MPTISPFMPQAASAQPQAPQGSDTGLVERWNSWLSNPANRAALIQFGTSLTQPPSFGDNTLSQIGRAVGSAGEAAQRVQTGREKKAAQTRKLGILEKEAESKGVAREARANAAAARAAAATAQAGTAAARLQNERERLSTQRTLGSLQRKIQATNAYNAYVRDKQKADSQASLVNPDFVPDPVLTPQQFYNRQGFGDLLQGGKAATGTSPVPPAEYPNARQAADGNWYVPDPERPGKYLRVDQ